MSDFTDDQLRAAFRNATADSPELPADAERVRAAAWGELSRAETDAMIDRIAADPDAALAWRLAAELQPEAEAPAPDNVVPLLRRPALWGALALAAAALLVVGLGTRSTPDAPAYRAGDDAPALISEVHTATAGTPVTLTWSDVDAARYRLVVSDAALRPVHRAELDIPRATLPAAATADRAGETLLWRVDAVLADGTVVPGPTWSLDVHAP